MTFFKILTLAFRGCCGQMTIYVEFLRLPPPNFAIVPECLAPHLEKVR